MSEESYIPVTLAAKRLDMSLREFLSWKGGGKASFYYQCLEIFFRDRLEWYQISHGWIDLALAQKSKYLPRPTNLANIFFMAPPIALEDLQISETDFLAMQSNLSKMQAPAIAAP